MWRRIRISLAAFVSLAGPAAAQRADDVAGLYAVNLRETASTLELAPDGRFVWFFTTGALDLVGRGRWRRDGDALILANDPPYRAPRFELVETSPSERPGVLVRVDRASRPYIPVLDAEAEYADGSREREPLGSGGTRFVDAPGRRLVAVRLGSLAYDVQSDRFAVDGSRTLTFRVEPNQIGRADLAGRRVTIARDALSLDFRGTQLFYARIPDARPGSLAVELAEMIAAAENGPAALSAVGTEPGGEIAGYVPSQPWETSETSLSAGRLEIQLGEPLSSTIARSTVPFRNGGELGNDFAAGVAEVGIRYGDRSFDAGRVTGLSWYVGDDGLGPTITAVVFSQQDRMLALDELLARVRALQAWLEQVGFAYGAPEGLEQRQFAYIHPYRYDEQASGWDAAQAVLADEEAGLHGMHFFTMHAGSLYAMVHAINLDRAGEITRNFEDGRAWVLNVEFLNRVEPAPRDDEAASNP